MEEAETIINDQKSNNRKLHAQGKKRYHKEHPAMRLQGPLPRDYYLRYLDKVDKDLESNVAQDTLSLPGFPAPSSPPLITSSSRAQLSDSPSYLTQSAVVVQKIIIYYIILGCPYQPALR